MFLYISIGLIKALFLRAIGNGLSYSLVQLKKLIQVLDPGFSAFVNPDRHFTPFEISRATRARDYQILDAAAGRETVSDGSVGGVGTTTIADTTEAIRVA